MMEQMQLRMLMSLLNKQTRVSDLKGERVLQMSMAPLTSEL